MELSTISYPVAALTLALTFGGMTFLSVVVAPLVFNKSALKIAGPFIRQVFPWYYLTMGAAILMLDDQCRRRCRTTGAA